LAGWTERGEQQPLVLGLAGTAPGFVLQCANTVAVVLPRSGCVPRCVPRFKGVLTSGQGKPTKPSRP
jgi:hypothetical protein